MTSLNDKAAHEDFFRKSGIFIILNSLTNLMELAFNGVAARLPGGEYATFWALLRIFFIVTVPLTGVQLVVSKEVAAYGALGEYGKRRQFIEKTYYYAIIAALGITAAGLCASPIIKSFLKMDSILPALFIFIVILFYFPLPLLYGTIQGLKKFYTLSLIQSVWGVLRVIFTGIALFIFSGGINMFFFAITIATILTVVVTAPPAKEVFATAKEPIDRDELIHGYKLIIPVILMLFAVTMMKNIDMVMAKHFFSDTNADAYACAALVGSAYFTISSIFMILFPMVSEEKAKGGNPFIFAKKSIIFVFCLSIPAMMVCWIFPTFVMHLITVGKYIPGAETLIKIIGFSVVPISIIFIIANYLLAKHKTGFIPVLLTGAATQLISIIINHNTPLSMIHGLIAVNTVTCVAMIVYLYIENR